MELNNYQVTSQIILENTVKPLNSRHLRVLKNLSVIRRYPLLGGSLTKFVPFETKHFVCYLFKACLLFGMSTIGRFHCIRVSSLHLIERKHKIFLGRLCKWFVKISVF